MLPSFVSNGPLPPSGTGSIHHEPIALNGAAGGNGTAARIPHHFTVDVEEYFQVSALESRVPRAYWGRLESRVNESVDRLLALLEERDARGTFFVLGWVARRSSALVKRISDCGHEIASHGWDHRRVPAQTPEEFRNSVRRTKEVLEDLTGRPVIGFRAPSFSLLPGHEWALDVLLEEGYRYDSSLFPIRRPEYGYPDGGRIPYSISRASGRIVEFPPATLRWWGVNLPAAGGAYLRLFPYALIRAAVNDLAASGSSATLYIHPWELDPDQPRFAVPLLTRIRHYGGLSKVSGRVARLLDEFSFQPIASTLADG